VFSSGNSLNTLNKLNALPTPSYTSAPGLGVADSRALGTLFGPFRVAIATTSLQVGRDTTGTYSDDHHTSNAPRLPATPVMAVNDGATAVQRDKLPVTQQPQRNPPEDWLARGLLRRSRPQGLVGGDARRGRPDGS